MILSKHCYLSGLPVFVFWVPGRLICNHAAQFGALLQWAIKEGAFPGLKIKNSEH